MDNYNSVRRFYLLLTKFIQLVCVNKNLYKYYTVLPNSVEARSADSVVRSADGVVVSISTCQAAARIQSSVMAGMVFMSRYLYS